MCIQCGLKPVYTFTNKRKICARCFIRYFQKKFLYTNRKFGLARRGDAVGFETGKDFRSVVLKDLLKFFDGKLMIEVAELDEGEFSSLRSISTPRLTLSNRSVQKIINKKNFNSERKNILKNEINKSSNSILEDDLSFNKNKRSIQSKHNEEARGKIEINKLALATTIDQEAENIIEETIYGSEKNMEKLGPVNENIIKPLYLFTNQEVELYAKLRKLKFVEEKKKAGRVVEFIDSLEKKHPEAKRAVVNSWEKLYFN